MPISFSFVFIRLVVLVFLSVCALFRHRRGRKTETSSDASDEAPERARNDAPKEVKLHEGSILFSRHSGEVSQASIQRFPWPQRWGATSATQLRGKSVCRGDLGHARLALAEVVYQKIKPANGMF